MSNPNFLQTLQCKNDSTQPPFWELAPGKPAYYWLPDEFRMKQVISLINAVGKDLTIIVNTGGVMAIPEAENYVETSIAANLS